MKPADAAPFAEVEPLFRAGRLGDAARALRRVARAGAPPWEMYLWLGRIAERRGRPAEAERAYRRALAADRGAPAVWVELSRFLEACGRADEAVALLSASAAQAAGELGLLSERLLDGAPSRGPGAETYAMMEFRNFRRAFVESVSRKAGDLERAVSAARAALAEVPQPGARTLLAELLLAAGRPGEAAAALAPAFRPEGAAAETSRFELLVRLAADGVYPPELERAVLGAAARGDAGARLARHWPQVFSALMCARRYDEAFRLGEAMLDLGPIPEPTRFLWPWWRGVRRAVAEQGFIRAERARLARAARSGRHRRWYAYYRAVLLSDDDRNAEAVRGRRAVRGGPPGRYEWMLQAFVLARLNLLDFDGAEADARVVLAADPGHWWVRCRLAESLLARGRTAAALREFDRARRSEDPVARREATTWKGEALLWLGRYARALAAFDAALAAGASDFVRGWRGAARLLSGDPAGALEDLDAAVKADPKDLEARTWRGEAHRLLGRRAQSRADLDAAVAAAADNLWASVDRALLADDEGDLPALAAHWRRVPPEVRAFGARAAGAGPRALRTRAGKRAALEACLAAAKGVRRWERYVQCVWMREAR